MTNPSVGNLEHDQNADEVEPDMVVTRLAVSFAKEGDVLGSVDEYSSEVPLGGTATHLYRIGRYKRMQLGICLAQEYTPFAGVAVDLRS